MDFETEVRTEFSSELDEIESKALRDKVVQAWTEALPDSEFQSIHEIPWWPEHEPYVGDEMQVPHVKDVTACSIALTDQLAQNREDLELDRNAVVAGALFHDVSKLRELTKNSVKEFEEFIPYPVYSMYNLEKIGFSTHIQHIVLAHTGRMEGVSPQTMEAQIVATSDKLVGHSTFLAKDNQLGAGPNLTQ